jgi:hypothetical protein
MKLRTVLSGVALIATGCIKAVGPTAIPCGAGGTWGSFEGQSLGVLSDTITAGCAYFSIDLKTGSFGMALTDGTPQGTNPMVRVVGIGLPTGALAIGDGSAPLRAAIFVGTRRFVVGSGSLVTRPIESGFGDVELDGSVEMTGTDSTGATMVVAGEFVARCIGNQPPEGGNDRVAPKPPAECRLPDAALRKDK